MASAGSSGFCYKDPLSADQWMMHSGSLHSGPFQLWGLLEALPADSMLSNLPPPPPLQCLASISSRSARPPGHSFQQTSHPMKSQSSHAAKVMVCPRSAAICSLSVHSLWERHHPAAQPSPHHAGEHSWEIKVIKVNLHLFLKHQTLTEAETSLWMGYT